ncbi:MAG: hypothetical protein V2A77_05235 [Pseudomonadota bacterium]
MKTDSQKEAPCQPTLHDAAELLRKLAEQKQEIERLTKAAARHAKLVLAAEKTLQDLRWMINNERYLTFDTLIGTEERLDAALAGCACATKGEPDGKKDL